MCKFRNTKAVNVWATIKFNRKGVGGGGLRAALPSSMSPLRRITEKFYFYGYQQCNYTDSGNSINICADNLSFAVTRLIQINYRSNSFERVI